MNIRIEYLEEPPRARVAGDAEVPAAIWNRVLDLVLRVDGGADVVGRLIETDWGSFLQVVPELARAREEYGSIFTYNPEARRRLQQYREEFRAVREVELVHPAMREEEIQPRLAEFGFARILTGEQRRDVVRMVSLRHAANFSVPGAGKTTVALAVHLLIRDPQTKFVVVAPKNAFGAWDEVLEECLDPLDQDADNTPFVRLEGGFDNIRRILAQEPARAIISYDQLARVSEVMIDYLRFHRVHLILDESHRMKAGDQSLRGAALLRLAHLPARRDILTGTPIPRSMDDIAPQLDFLWPGQGLGRRIAQADEPGPMLRGLYVRTTKGELGLAPPIKHWIPVEMSPAQLSLYALMREQILSRLAGIRTDPNIDLPAARRSVIRLLQVASNPILTVRRLTAEAPRDFPYNDPLIERIFGAIVAEPDSPKLIRACELARTILNGDPNSRVVIWSCFTETVERLAELLSDFGATFIHGGVPTGAAADLSTREGRIRAFHDESGTCRVLVANPAACSEGISLHRICHHAIYVDRSYNAGHFLQSVDRIHRLGLPPEIETHVYVLESIAPGVVGSIDYAVRRRLVEKLHIMAQALEDADLRRLALDEEEGDEPLDYDIQLEDIADLIDELSGVAEDPGEEQL
jgi:SNF2 family DNA or RNA helicase